MIVKSFLEFLFFVVIGCIFSLVFLPGLDDLIMITKYMGW